MTDHTDPPRSTDVDPDDAFEKIARTAGAALRRPAPSDGFARLQSVRRRQQIVRSSLVVGSAAIVVVVGLIALNRPSEETIAPTDSPATSTTSAPASTTSSTTTSTIPVGPSLGYTLAGIDGLTPTYDPVATDAGGGQSLVIAWSAATGIIDGFIALHETPDDLGRTEPEGDVTSVPIDVPDGRGYLVTANDANGQPMTLLSATRLMWWRGDGRLWQVSNFDVAPERLTQLTLAIQPGSGLPYVLPEPGTTFVGFNTSESYESVGQGWSLDGSDMVLAITTGGIAQQIADTTAVSVVERTIAGGAGYAITLPDGQVNLSWPTANPDRWGSLSVSAPLVPRIDEIIAAITPV